jgi:outer membrane protein TolC
MKIASIALTPKNLGRSIATTVMALALCALCHGTAATAQTTYTLQQLTDSALQNNIATRSARLNIQMAAQQRKEAFTKYFPNVSGVAAWFNANKGMAKMEIDPTTMVSPDMATAMAQMLPAEALAALQTPLGMTMMKNGTIASITALQPIFAGGRIVNGNKLAKLGEDVSQLQLQLSQNEVEKQTAQYYWQLVALNEKMNTIAAVDTLLADIHKDVDVAVRAGVAMRNDLLQVQLRQNDVKGQKLKLQNGIAILRLMLAQYCGLKDSGFGIAAIHTPEKATPQMPKNAGCQGLICLPEYQLLEKQVEAATLQKRLTLGQSLPSLAVGAGYNYHNLLDLDRSFAMVYATLSVPITDWWGGSHAIKRKKLERQQAIDQLNDNAQLLTIRMQKAYNDMVEAEQQLDLAHSSTEQAEENLRLNRDYYRAGTTRMADLLEAQLLYQQTLDHATDAYAELQNKILAYRQATGQQ